ncbi:MAG: RagB/SusD family nutrient uptake outer membrane protein, partial [Dysgonamonadaceae bacterium]|nr:RagB/SusD family nutrient uptake outer membrane protein [Dysgonamonadaceae bacterium]
MKKSFKYIIGILALTLMPACEDWLDTKPLDKMVFEDYWKTKNDVESVVLASYRAMLSDEFMERILISGEFRSDNIRIEQNMDTHAGIKDIFNLTIQVTNDFAKWEIFYKIINYCNAVLTYAPGIREIDPNYTEGWLQVHFAEAYTIRALTYFYLVRIYGDVPFVVRPYADDTENFNIGFSSEEEILNTLIADLKIAEQYAVISRGNATPSDKILTKGRVTKNAVRALMADIYLWLASG